MLELLTVESWDYFEKQKFLLGASYSGDELSVISNLQQLLVSGVWLLFSSVLMGIGLWKRRRSVRLMSIALFGLTILKIFLYDLSFLDTLYRIFSFIGLGVVLLAASFLYQKYKAIIIGDVEEASTPEA